MTNIPEPEDLVFWAELSEESGKHVGRCNWFSSLRWDSEDENSAIAGIEALVNGLLQNQRQEAQESSEA